MVEKDSQKIDAKGLLPVITQIAGIQIINELSKALTEVSKTGKDVSVSFTIHFEKKKDEVC